jgi:signal transduction histidine kinase
VTLGIPAIYAPILLAKALSRQLLVYAACCLVIAEISLIAMGVSANSPSVVGAALLFLFPGLVLTGLMFWPPKPWGAVLYLAAAAFALYFATSTVLVSVPNAHTTALAPIALVSLAMTLASGAATSVRGRVVWAVTGMSVSVLVVYVAAFSNQGEFRLDARAIIGALVIVGIAFIVPSQVTLATKGHVAFDESLAVVEEDGERAILSRGAIAQLHDTLLADLTVLTKIKPGPLSAQMRAMLGRELEQLVSSDWLVAAMRETAKKEGAHRLSSPASEQFLHAIDASSKLGLDVNMSGDLAALDDLSGEAVVALTGAIGQCFSNVRAHAQTTHVDVVVLQSGDAVTVTVIDGGAGFEPDAVAVDRLGLRVSVRSRIESVGGFVKIWSAPAQGTAIMLQLPYGRVS